MNTEILSLRRYAGIVLMVKELFDAGKIDRAFANKLTEGIAEENELRPIYIW